MGRGFLNATSSRGLLNLPLCVGGGCPGKPPVLLPIWTPPEPHPCLQPCQSLPGGAWCFSVPPKILLVHVLMGLGGEGAATIESPVARGGCLGAAAASWC